MFDYYRIALAVPIIKLGDSKQNGEEIYKMVMEANKHDVQILLFPELCVTGATCGDLFCYDDLINEAEETLNELAERTAKCNLLFIVGAPFRIDNMLQNCAVAFHQGHMQKLSKQTISSMEQRFFIPANDKPQSILLNDKFVLKVNFGNEISHASLNLNLCAAPYAIDSCTTEMIQAKCIDKSTSCVFVNAGFGESTTDYVYAGEGVICENGNVLKHTQMFSTKSQLTFADVELKTQPLCSNSDAYIKIHLPELKSINKNFEQKPFVNLCKPNEILSMQRNAILTRMNSTHIDKLIMGVSGGLDSTLTLLTAVLLKDYVQKSREDIIGVTMPGFATSNNTFNNATELMNLLGITQKTISITKACEQHLLDIEHDKRDVVFENAQARERTQILFDLANKHNALVLGTGDMTEAVLGFATYNGDHISNYNPNCNIPKTVVHALIEFICAEGYFTEDINFCLKRILNTPISPELSSPNQISEDIVGPYELNDFFMYHMLKNKYSRKKIIFIAKLAFDNKYDKLDEHFDKFYRRFITQQFKRSVATDGPQVFSFGLSPRGSFIMPSDIEVR